MAWRSRKDLRETSALLEGMCIGVGRVDIMEVFCLEGLRGFAS